MFNLAALKNYPSRPTYTSTNEEQLRQENQEHSLIKKEWWKTVLEDIFRVSKIKSQTLSPGSQFQWISLTLLA